MAVHYKSFENFVEINFEGEPLAIQIFEKNLDCQRIIRDLNLQFGYEIIPGKTLLFFDECQVAPRAMLALRYFYETMPDLHVVAAGSLLDFAIEEIGIPVGRIPHLLIVQHTP